MKALGLCTRQVSKGRSYILWDIASLMTRILSNPVNQGNLSKYWPHTCKKIWTHGKADYGLHEEHWSHTTHFDTCSDSAGRTGSGLIFQKRTQPNQYKYIIMQEIE
jgi:hypothetical protein